MPNRVLLALANQERLARISLEHPLLRPAVLRFVAGSRLEDAVAVVRSLNSGAISASLDHLGENTIDRDGAFQATAAYIEALHAIAASELEANISVKLTALGLDIEDSVAEENLTAILNAASDLHTFVRVDMEGSAYTARTLEIIDHVRASGHLDVGPVIQAYLYRSASDVEKLIRDRVRVRLVKGAYDEAANVAFRRKRDTDRNFVRLMQRLLEHGCYPAIATHDQALINCAREFVQARAISPGGFEFQMLYGVRRDLQDALAGAGYNVRVYVPYGSQWYPYLVRRIAERPANLAFVLSNVARDGYRSTSSEQI